MKRYGNLFDEIVNTHNLYLAAKKAFRGKKSKEAVALFYFNLENEILRMKRELTDGTYCPQKYTVFKIYEPKERRICCADIYDRVVHLAVTNVLHPIFERRLIDETHACRLGKGPHAALKRSQRLVKKYDFYLKCDIQKYFESIDHKALKSLIRKIFKDKRLIDLFDKIISHKPPYTEPGKGLPIENLTSQHLANIYLGELDFFIKHRLRCKGYIRYMDDFILFSNDKTKLRSYLEKIRLFISTKLKLRLKEKVVKIAPVSEGLPFLGYRIFRGLIRLQRGNLIRFRKKVRKLEKRYLKGEIDESDLINSMRSVIVHVSHGNTKNLRGTVFG
ncbi:MAG: reverse transcriptase/maturase family protein [Bacteriovoracales bacterium]|nr:reverse transcriptase/maturase family protein [Bacteriovoracales bacterium]